MKSYRESHQRIIVTERYEGIIYGPTSYDSYLWEAEKKILLRELDVLVRQKAQPRLLDFACGTGRVIEYLEGRVGESVGVDISREMLDLARPKLRHSELVEGDLTRLDLLPGREFDLITAFRFFLNAEPMLRQEALDVLISKLARGGTLIFNIHGNTWSFRLVMAWWYWLVKGRKLNHISYWGSKKLLESHGLVIERFYGVGVVPKPLYRYLPRFIFSACDRIWAGLPLARYFSYNLIFVCRKR